MGRGMVSHTAWRAHVTVKGAGAGRQAGWEETQEPETRATLGTLSTTESHQQIHRVSLGNARCGPSRETGEEPQDQAADAASFCH